jgi:hypothetical protein
MTGTHSWEVMDLKEKVLKNCFIEIATYTKLNTMLSQALDMQLFSESFWQDKLMTNDSK